MTWAAFGSSAARSLPLALSALAALAIFLVDAALPRGFAVHGAYVAVVLSGFWWPRRGYVLGGAALCALLTLLGDASAWFGPAPYVPSLNRFQTIVLLAIAAAVVVTYRRSEGRAAGLAAIVESSEDAIFSVTANGTVQSWNRAAERLLGHPAASMLGRPEWEIVPPELLDETRALMAAVLAGERPAPFDSVRLTRDGRRIDVSVRVSPVRDAWGEILGMSVILRDITARRTAELQADRLRAAEAALAHMARVVTIGELSTSIAHELNQPLAGVVANGDACRRWLAIDPPDVAAARRSVGFMIDDARRASEVVERVRAALRKAPPERQPLDINGLITETVALAQRLAGQARATITTDLGPDLPPVVADRVQVQQVLLNLLVNALEAASESAGPRRDVTVRSGSAAPDAVRVSVHDSGPGIAPELRQRIFEPFFSTKPHGLGLGLTLSASLVERMGGRLRVQPSDGGAHLELWLPATAT